MKKINNKTVFISLLFSLCFLVPACFGQGAPLPAGAISAADPARTKDAAVTDPLQEKISVDYKDVDIADILRSLSYTYGLNLVTASEIKGKITISLKDVTISEALEAILSGNGYNYSRKGNILYISPGSIEGAQVISVPLTLKYLKAVDAQNLVRKVLSNKGDIKVDEVANMLVVTDYPASIEKLKELLKGVDQPPRQVLIEAKIVDMTSKDLQNLGVTWTTKWNPSNSSKIIKATETLAGTSSTLSGGQFKLDSLILNGINATATIDALVQDQKAHLLASPSIAVLNNREARIIIGEKVPYKEKTQTTTGTTETTKYIDVGTTLRVTPSINADGYITLAIHPEVSSVSALLDAGPRITTREADTTVRVKEGETIVICGLIKQDDTRVKSRIPVLGYIPIIQYLFSNSSRDHTQTELAIFITPKILLSRAEMLTENKTRYEEEAYVNIMSTADLNVQSKLFENAKNLQLGSGLESRDKESWQRRNQALSLYECIVTQFPDGPKAPESAYQAALLYDELGEYYLAKEMCAKVLSKYSDSPFADKAKNLQKGINLRLRKEARSKAENEMNKIRELTKEEHYQEAQQREDADLNRSLQETLQKNKIASSRQAHLEGEKARRIREREEAKARLEETRQKTKLESVMIKEYRQEQAQIAKEENRKQAEQKARVEKEVYHKSSEQAKLTKEEVRKQAVEKARLEKEARQKADEEARLAKEEQRKKAAAEAIAKKEEARKQAEQARITKEEARKQAQEQARIMKEQKQKAAEEARLAKEEQRKKAAAEAIAKKEKARKQAEQARLTKEVARKQAAAEAAAKKVEILKQQEQARIAKEEARQQAEHEREKARLEKEARQKAAEEARKQAQAQARIAKEEARKQAEQARIAKEEARLAKEEQRKKAAAEAAAKKEEARRQAEHAREKARLEKEAQAKATDMERLKQKADEMSAEVKQLEEKAQTYEDAWGKR